MGGTLDPYGNPGGGPSSWEGTFATDPAPPGTVQLGGPQQDKTWSPTQGWRPGSDMPYPQQAMDANADFWRSKGLQSLGGVSPQQVQQQGNPQYSNLLDLSPDQQQYAQKQRLEYQQGAGLGSLQGPTQQKIKQGYQV